MWLPKDERKLLEIYYLAIQKYIEKINSSPFKEKWYNIRELVETFQAKDFKRRARILEDVFVGAGKGNKDDDKSDDSRLTKERVKKYLNGRASIDVANAVLLARKLIIIKEHNSMTGVRGISLTTEGYDLGRKYSDGRLMRLGLWFREYKDYGIEIIAGFLGGVTAVVVIEILKYIVFR